MPSKATLSLVEELKTEMSKFQEKVKGITPEAKKHVEDMSGFRKDWLQNLKTWTDFYASCSGGMAKKCASVLTLYQAVKTKEVTKLAGELYQLREKYEKNLEKAASSKRPGQNLVFMKDHEPGCGSR